jgi:RNA polymerase sigma factor (sigma-70 family)
MAIAPSRPDSALLERLRARDRTAWDELYRLYEGRLYGFSYRLTGNPHDAADLVQETFVRALPRLDRLPPERADIGAYLFATAKNLFLKTVERGKRQQPFDEVPEPSEPGHIDEDPQRAALLHRQQEEVRLANGKLAPRQRLVLALRELEDRSYAEIGELVGLNENAVAQLISRARQSLREELRLVQVDRSRLPAECQSFLPLLSAHLDGQLSGPKLDETIGHLDSCERCQEALADMREAQRRYRALVPPLAGLVALRERIGDALGASGYWPPPRATFWRRLGPMRPRTAVVITVAGLAGLGAVGGGVAQLAARQPAPSVAAAPTESSPPEPAASETVSSQAFTETQPPANAAPVAATETAATTEAPPPQTATEEGEAETETETGTTVEPVPATTESPSIEPEPAPATDTTAPSVEIVSGPPSSTGSTAATFEFTASEPVTFLCTRDGGATKPCTSPTTYEGLALGLHSFALRAVDGAGNGSPPVTWGWLVEAPAVAATEEEPPATTEEPPAIEPPPPDLPDLVITRLTSSSVTVTNVGSASAGPFSVHLPSWIGDFYVTAGLAPGASASRSWTACAPGTIDAVADGRAEVAESNERNNSASTPAPC